MQALHDPWDSDLSSREKARSTRTLGTFEGEPSTAEDTPVHGTLGT